MRNINITITVTIFFTIILACTTNHKSLPVHPQKAETENRLGNVQNSELRKGSLLAKTECAECHRFYYPEEYSPEDWNRIIKGKAQRLSLGKDQIDALDVYFKEGSNTLSEEPMINK